MTLLARSRLNAALGLAIPTAGLWYLMSSGFQSATLPAVGVVVGSGVLWLAAVMRLNTLPVAPRTGAAREARHVTAELSAVRLARMPAYVVNVSRPVRPWRWTDGLIAPVELLAVAWSVPVMILLIMVPVGFVVASALWLGRLIL